MTWLRLGGAVVALVVLVGLVSAPLRAHADPVIAGGDGSSLAMARRSGARVEIMDRRTETTRVFANPSGTFTAEEYARPVRVRGADGSWHDVDNTLRRE